MCCLSNTIMLILLLLIPKLCCPMLSGGGLCPNPSPLYAFGPLSWEVAVKQVCLPLLTPHKVGLKGTSGPAAAYAKQIFIEPKESGSQDTRLLCTRVLYSALSLGNSINSSAGSALARGQAHCVDHMTRGGYAFPLPNKLVTSSKARSTVPWFGLSAAGVALCALTTP